MADSIIENNDVNVFSYNIYVCMFNLVVLGVESIRKNLSHGDRATCIFTNLENSQRQILNLPISCSLTCLNPEMGTKHICSLNCPEELINEVLMSNLGG